MSARVTLEGFEAFRAALRNLPEELADEAADIVTAAADEAGQQIQSGYPQGPTGNLKGRVVRQASRTPFGASATVTSRAPHAAMFEKGTRQRHTSRGWNRGRMPAASDQQAMIPKVVRARRKMQNALIELLRRAGFTVSGT